MIKELLVIEDNKKHRQDALRVLTAGGYDHEIDGPVESSKKRRYIAGSLEEALEFIEGRWLRTSEDGSLCGGEVGVLTDLYFTAEIPRTGSGADFGELAPLGLVVALRCRELGLPCVIVTAGYHHGQRYHQVHSAVLRMGLSRMVDSSNSEAEAEEKNWKKGLEKLEALAAQIGAG